MLSISMFINVIWIPVIAIVSAFLGFMFRTSQIKKSKKRITYLENEMLNNHAEILKLHQDLGALKKEEELSSNKSRVVAMKESPQGQNPENPETSHRKRI